MPGLAALAFAQPWLLLGLVALPAIWWLLRVTPPAPRRVLFPPMRLLERLSAREETPSHTPWWLLLLRLAIAALLILGFARPVLNPQATAVGTGPLLLVVDDGWAAAPGWNRRMELVRELIGRADRDGREVIVLRTAPGDGATELLRAPAGELLGDVASWKPKPWPADRASALRALEKLDTEPAAVVWLSDGVAVSASDAAAAAALGDRLDRLGAVRVAVDPPAERAVLLRPPAAGQTGLPVVAERVDTGPARELRVLAVGSRGEVLGHAPLAFAAGSATAEAALDLPAERRNRVERLEIEAPRSAGGVALVDERWRRRAVGLVGAVDAAESQPLLAEAYFIERALRPFAEIHGGSVQEILTQPASMIILPDTVRVADSDRAALEAWIDKGGVLVRFAGPRLARGEDDFVPVPLRTGDRRLGGALSWAEPLPLAPFPTEGPFAGLAVPADVTVSRQVLARPGPDLAASTLATLADGTPLVTGAKRGEGWLVLVHTSANATWSTLPLSGLFVDMLRRLVALAPGVPGALRGLVAPDRILEGDGTLVAASPASPIEVETLLAEGPGPTRPPGFWGPATAPTDPTAGRVALSPASGVEALQPIDRAFTHASVGEIGTGREVDLMPFLLAAALLLALVDLLVGLVLRGHLALRRAAPAALALGLVVALPAFAQDADRPLDPKVVDAALGTRLAYVLTGDAEIDRISESGLAGLGVVLDERTAIRTEQPAPIDLESDELELYPILYWPIRATQPEISDAARERLSAYLRNGGMLVVDTGDGGSLLPGQDEGGPGAERAAQVLAGLDLPALVQVPPEHVLTRSFYLLQDFPGRWAGQPVWVDRVNPAVNDGVAGIVMGGNDWAGAWAMDEFGAPLLPTVPGGEQQREMARRFGVNLAMYALSGNYKTDQVHVPALLERLGQ